MFTKLVSFLRHDEDEDEVEDEDEDEDKDEDEDQDEDEDDEELYFLVSLFSSAWKAQFYELLH